MISRRLVPARSAVLASLLAATCGEVSGTGPYGSAGPDTDGDSDGSGGSSGSGDGETGPLYDLGDDTGDGPPCGCEVEYVWIANSEESTVSKIRVDNLEEVGRYLTRADGAGNPSRTSVSLAGDVAVANRHAGLVKFFGHTAACPDDNGMPGVQTSTGKGDVLAWDEEECRAWYVDFPTTNQRPVAWAQGQVTPGTCMSTDEKVWTVTSAVAGLLPGVGGPGGVIVHVVDGETGGIDKQVQIDTFPGGSLGAYGGAVDAAGNLYFTSMGPGGKLARVDRGNYAYQIWSAPQGVAPYGITVDHNGRVWVSSNSVGQTGAARFDPETETWEVVGGFWGASGLAEGPGNLMWVSSHVGISSVDIDTLVLGEAFTTPELVKGIGFDSEGNMFAVTYATEDDMGMLQGNDWLLKIDPETLIVDEYYDGLSRPYTYSDMTGYALGNVTCPPEG